MRVEEKRDESRNEEKIGKSGVSASAWCLLCCVCGTLSQSEIRANLDGFCLCVCVSVSVSVGVCVWCARVEGVPPLSMLSSLAFQSYLAKVYFYSDGVELGGTVDRVQRVGEST